MYVCMYVCMHAYNRYYVIQLFLFGGSIQGLGVFALVQHGLSVLLFLGLQADLTREHLQPGVPVTLSNRLKAKASLRSMSLERTWKYMEVYHMFCMHTEVLRAKRNSSAGRERKTD